MVPARDARALAEAILRIARAHGLVERMGRSAREQVIARFTSVQGEWTTPRPSGRRSCRSA